MYQRRGLRATIVDWKKQSPPVFPRSWIGKNNRRRSFHDCGLEKTIAGGLPRSWIGKNSCRRSSTIVDWEKQLPAVLHDRGLEKTIAGGPPRLWIGKNNRRRSFHDRGLKKTIAGGLPQSWAGKNNCRRSCGDYRLAKTPISLKIKVTASADCHGRSRSGGPS